MKKMLLLGTLGLLIFCSSAPAVSRPVAPADTVAGHARMVKKIHAAMCTSVSNDRTTAFDKMTPPDAMQYTQQLFVNAMQRDSVAFLALINSAAKEGKTSQAVGMQLGKDVVLLLSSTCPAALPLIVKLSQTEQAQQAAGSKMPVVTEAEKKILLPLAIRICTQLTAAEAKQAFAKRTPAQRTELFTGIMVKEFQAGRAQLLRYYSVAQLDDAEQRGEIGKKMASLMLERKDCGGYIMQLGVDALAKQ